MLDTDTTGHIQVRPFFYDFCPRRIQVENILIGNIPCLIEIKSHEYIDI